MHDDPMWGMMRGVGVLRKSIHQSWLAKGLGFLCWGFNGVQEEIPSKVASTLQIVLVAFPPGQWTSQQRDNIADVCCDNRDETINHIASECSKLTQKEYKTKHNWVGKVIHWEMCKKFKFDLPNKWYMHNPASVRVNVTHKLLWEFDVQTDHLISAGRLDLIIINKKKKKENWQNCRLCCPGWPQNKTERMWKEK